ncbi:MAG TPA: hypothetical protein DEO65_17620 [Bacillus bacterium]|uniref:hypothetical protein n=1 Tax=Siminovitchia fordii TaxID=254759 RepID=UPI000362B30F|nr:hypothetical protein [Siminovitchia fordii]HBZ11655.1 hypothetical protein [Bacillus sp. (in: firmicutes)]
MRKGLLVGLYAGVISGAAGVATAYLLGAVTGLWFSQLNWISIAVASIIANIAGAMIFVKWLQKTARPSVYYVLLTGGVTLLSSLNVLANPPADKFGVIAQPVHVVVFLLSIWLVPMWLKRRKQTQVSGTSITNNKG